MIVIDGKIIKVIPEYPEYGASECGEVYRITKKKKMAKRVTEIRGYKSYYTRICMFNKPKNVKTHRLVALAWLGQPPSDIHTDINHKNGNSLDNRVSNLEWCTKSQNQRHAVETGLKGVGEKLYNSQLTDNQVHEICKKLQDGALTKDLSDAYNVSKDIIRKIKAGDTYFHVRQLYVIDHKYLFNFSEATIKWVCLKINEGLSDKGIVEISTNPNLTIIEIKRIRYKIRYSWISDQYF